MLAIGEYTVEFVALHDQFPFTLPDLSYKGLVLVLEAIAPLDLSLEYVLDARV